MREMNEELQIVSSVVSNSASTGTTDQIAGGNAITNGVERIGSYTNEYDALDQDEDRAYKSLPSNLRSIQYKVLETLSSVQRPCAHQDPKKISLFLDAISAWERGKPVIGMTSERSSDAPIAKEMRLTKGEKLMLINQAPRELAVLHAIVEEIHERLNQEQQYDLLAIIGDILPLEELTMDQDQEMTDVRAAANPTNTDMDYDGNGEALHVGEGVEEDGIVDDTDELENEGRGEGAIDDEGREDE
ncbi:hypothetical protein CBS101457_005452 [Exobasidium rhododendri]|nr:hypothetical protein CBS101457_005452 [Exobasidium rhododendri]